MVNRLISIRYLSTKTILGILVAVVLAMGIAAPVVMNATENATKLNMDDNYFHSIVNSHLKEGINETSCIEHINRIFMGTVSR